MVDKKMHILETHKIDFKLFGSISTPIKEIHIYLLVPKFL